MIKIVKISIIAVFVSASFPFIGTITYNNLSAQDKKEVISKPEKSSIDNKSSASEFTPAALETKSKQEEQILIKVAAVILVIWAGIAFFLFHIERKLGKIEDSLKD